jgi:two-component system, OmpR family, sensor histidine kinase CpxA
MMRFPLYAKILLWFFLNLLLLAVAFSLFLGAQLHFGLDSLLAGRAGDRIRAVSEILTRELNLRPIPEWDEIIARFNEAYRVQFYLFRTDGAQLAGQRVALPAAVRARVAELAPPAGLRGAPGLRPRQGLRGPPLEQGPPDFGGPGLDDGPPNPSQPRRGPEPRFVVHTATPGQYWVVVRTAVHAGERQPFEPMALLAMSGSLSFGGLFFEATPWLLAGGGVIVFSVLFWIPLVRGITRSVAQMTQATARIAEGRFDVRVDDRRADELGLLGAGINRMASRLEHLVNGQKRFLGDIAHELCSPLARLRMALGILEARAEPDSQTYVTVASDKAAQMAALVNELLSFSKAALGSAPASLNAVALHPVAAQALQREGVEGVTLHNAVPPDLCVRAEPELLTRALANLLRNAVRYAGPAGPITVSAQRAGAEVHIRVTDEGPGIPETELGRVFDPFYRLDASRDRQTGGVGLGLAIVQTCVASCGGTVTAHNRAPHGLEVLIRLPCADMSVSAAAPA